MTEVDFHQEVQAAVVEAFRAHGNKVEENIRLSAPNPDGDIWSYDADFIGKPPSGAAVIVEIKTSLEKNGFDDFDGSEFRRKQF